MKELVPSNEEIARNLYTPYHYDIQKQKVKPAAFKPPAGSNEISVLRLHLWSVEKVLGYGKLCENAGKTFMGTAILKVGDIRQEDILEVFASPMKDELREIFLDAHADIVYLNYTTEKGKEAPPEILFLMKKLADLASFNFRKHENS